ncbi:divisome-associated lipoprotein YraP [Shewanella sp. WXL01]|uniref:Divisome-associated lipoprotein YraP n=1 Tax=Shewanella maritima TaxID=2520507 RepID=A0A411PIN9_9GAMM|nr:MULTISPECIES: division/outer membrane stress-associated lipid-binding lipoprotein [Shewanella]NKF52199.1 divisome-associated lipoprotein YraP [Shewanella sp. WXL01]QBF83459.1 divisome-associated lipoprotein YraP [Shewanella maritima]
MIKPAALITIALLLQGCAGALMVGAVGGAKMANDERSMMTQFNDTDAGFNIINALSQDKELSERTNISGVVVNTNVLLIGQAPSSALRDRAVNIVQGLEIGGKLHNQIRIGNPTSFTSRSNDAWITTKVKTRMLNNNDLDITRVKVVTENGEVFLLGLIERSQADIAVDIARNTTGVRKVIKVFEYVEPTS